MNWQPEQYRVVAGVRERCCARCTRWLPHTLAHYYAHAQAHYGLHTTCRDCMCALMRGHFKRRLAYHRQQRQFARMAMAGRAA